MKLGKQIAVSFGRMLHWSACMRVCCESIFAKAGIAFHQALKTRNVQRMDLFRKLYTAERGRDGSDINPRGNEFRHTCVAAASADDVVGYGATRRNRTRYDGKGSNRIFLTSRAGGFLSWLSCNRYERRGYRWWRDRHQPLARCSRPASAKTGDDSKPVCGVGASTPGRGESADEENDCVVSTKRVLQCCTARE